MSVTSGSGRRQATYARVSVTSGSGWQQAIYAHVLPPEVWVWLTPSHICTCLCHRKFGCDWRQATYARVSVTGSLGVTEARPHTHMSLPPEVWVWLTPSHICTCLCHRECGNGWPSTRQAYSSLSRSCAWWSLFSCEWSRMSRTCRYLKWVLRNKLTTKKNYLF